MPRSILGTMINYDNPSELICKICDTNFDNSTKIPYACLPIMI